ncbi:alkylhydroperoxidase family enzyme [Nitrobacteraceae bacterium AZCC 1564]
MRKFIMRRVLRAFSKRYNYDASYLEMMLDEAPSAFFEFAKIEAVSRHREVVPVEAYFAAKLVGALKEDCGPCVQLVVDMALEAGMPNNQLEAVLRGDVAAMTAPTAIAFRFAQAVEQRSPDENEYRDVVRAEWSDKGVIELTLALTISRVFPMLKAGLGYAAQCRRIAVEGQNVDVVKQAA